MGRGISGEFILELKKGFLKGVLELVKCDPTLCLEIRKNYINIYYRGGNIIKIEEIKGKFKASFNRKYLDPKLTNVPKLPSIIEKTLDINVWISAIPHMKHEMDIWFANHPKDEREFQQLILRQNNVGKSAKGTDYFICDLEYANSLGTFDMVAVKWESTSASRRKNRDLRLSFIEVKNLDSSLSGTAGLRKHIKDINSFLGEPEALKKIKEEMISVFNQKLELGLINNQNSIKSFSDDIPELILVLINHDPESSKLRTEINKIPDCPNAEIKIATSNFMGYGLYSQSIYTLDDFITKYKRRIYDRDTSTIITHGDIDGMVCAAQLIRREKSDYDLIFSNAKCIKNALKKILTLKIKPSRIYICDIPANNDVVKIIADLSENGIKIFWIDHHPWESGIKKQIEKYCEKIVYNESLRTPAGVIMGQWLKDEDSYLDQIGKICYAYAKGSEWERNWFRLLSSYIGNCEENVLKRLAFKRALTQKDMQRIEQKNKDEAEAARILRETPQTVSAFSGKVMAIYDTSKKSGIYLGSRVFKFHDVDYCLIRISGTKWQFACNPSKKCSMKHLMGNQSIEEQNFHIAGRQKELLAIELCTKKFDPDPHILITKWLSEKI